MKCQSVCVVSKLHSCALGLAFGIVKGLFLMLFAWSAMYWGFGLDLIMQISHVYQGYEASWVGGLIGGGYGLLVGFIAGVLIGFIYNLCLCCCRCGPCGDKSGEMHDDKKL